jgi:bifunctional DNA-binding transcriptional regulator/antitoxin component of YhaV-PrlF toxin-antitoxin module
MRQEFSKDVTITEKGQLTLPVKIRDAMNLGRKRKVRVTMSDNGLVTMRPLADVMSLFGVLKNGTRYDPDEKRKARQSMGRRVRKR